jgi:hypothetical protein
MILAGEGSLPDDLPHSTRAAFFRLLRMAHSKDDGVPNLF